MPGYDGTGPMGQGSRTGWGMGNCPPEAGQPAMPAMGRRGGYGMGRGMGQGRGFGRGRGRGMGPGMGRGYGRGFVMYQNNPYPPQITKEQEIEYLKKESEAINTRINQLENTDK